MIRSRELLDQGADPDYPYSDSSWITPLHRAAQLGNIEIVNALLDEGTDGIDTQNSFGFTSLHLSCMCGHPDVVKILIDRGSNR